MSDKLFFDDIRLAPDGDVEQGGEWHVVRTVDEAISILQEHADLETPITHASLDHDMGFSYKWPDEWTLTASGTYECLDGMDLLREMSRLNLWPDFIYVHSANPWGRQEMREYIAWRNGVPSEMVPYTEVGRSEKQEMYQKMWDTIHNLENQGFAPYYGCEWDTIDDFAQMELWNRSARRTG